MRSNLKPSSHIFDLDYNLDQYPISIDGFEHQPSQTGLAALVGCGDVYLYDFRSYLEKPLLGYQHPLELQKERWKEDKNEHFLEGVVKKIGSNGQANSFFENTQELFNKQEVFWNQHLWVKGNSSESLPLTLYEKKVFLFLQKAFFEWGKERRDRVLSFTKNLANKLDGSSFGLTIKFQWSEQKEKLLRKACILSDDRTGELFVPYCLSANQVKHIESLLDF